MNELHYTIQLCKISKSVKSMIMQLLLVKLTKSSKIGFYMKITAAVLKDDTM